MDNVYHAESRYRQSESPGEKLATQAKTRNKKSMHASEAVNLYLIGFMGVGKSVVGRSVAAMLGMTFIDSDKAIEDVAQRNIPAIFETLGESAFRKMEREFIESGHPARGCVVSCGGGLPIEPGMRELLLSKGVVVCLFASEKTILARTAATNKRPLLDVEDREQKVRQLMARRMPVYMNTGIGISTENRTLAEITNHVIHLYRAEERRFLASHPE
jgi:shikimate kinase